MNNARGFADLLPDDGIVIGLAAADKAALFAALAGQVAVSIGAPAAMILERVSAREALGTTGFGMGTAIPHARLPGLGGVVALLARLAAGVDYGALDGEPVDIAVLLLSPEGAGADHLKALARISRALRDPVTVAAIRDAADPATLRAVISDTTARRAA